MQPGETGLAHTKRRGAATGAKRPQTVAEQMKLKQPLHLCLIGAKLLQ